MKCWEYGLAPGASRVYVLPFQLYQEVLSFLYKVQTQAKSWG